MSQAYSGPNESGITPDSEAFVAGLKAQQAWAFEQLLCRFEAPVYRFFYFSHRDHDRALDDCADTFVTLISAVQNFKGDATTLTSFVFGIARNIQRRGWRRLSVHQNASDDELAMIIDPSPSAFSQLSRRRDFQQAMTLIEQFNDPARQVMLLRFVEDLKISEIATALALSENTVKSHLRRGCEKLRSLMSDKSDKCAGEE